MSIKIKEWPLFGGAISIEMPTDYVDSSRLRQVPDNQEVFLQHNGPTSVIIEILECPQDLESRNEGCLHYIKELTEDDGSFQLLSRVKEEAGKDIIHAVVDRDVDIKMCLHRLHGNDTDILVTMNRQVPSDPLSFIDMAKSLTVKDWSLFK